MIKEEWKVIKDYPNYEVSNYGRVKSIKNNIILKLKDVFGYQQIMLYKNGKSKHIYVHRLVAENFIGDRNNREVNHIDANKKNNRVDNLEWVTHQENLDHGVKMALYNPITINQYDMQGNFIETHVGIRQASLKYKLSSSTISRCCKGIYKQCGGYVWKYANDKVGE